MNRGSGVVGDGVWRRWRWEVVECGVGGVWERMDL